MPTLPAIPTLLACSCSFCLLLPFPLPLLLLLSSKSIILSATNAALFLPTACSDCSDFCAGLRCEARLAQICTPKTPETTSVTPSPPHLPLLCYAFCLLFAAARPLLTLKCIFYGNFKCNIPIPLPACLQISAACPAIINVRKCIVYVA